MSGSESDDRRVLFRVMSAGHPPFVTGDVHAEDYALSIQWASTGERIMYHNSADPMTFAPGSIRATTNVDSLWRDAQEAAQSGAVYWANLDFSGPYARLSDTVPERLLQAIHKRQTIHENG
jgi:hypothetical protein